MEILYSKTWFILLSCYLYNKQQSRLTFFSTPLIRIRIGFENAVAEPPPVAMEIAKKQLQHLKNNFIPAYVCLRFYTFLKWISHYL